MYKSVYYKLYKFAKRTEKSWNSNMRMPELVAFFSISFLIMINLTCIIVILSKYPLFLKDYKLTFIHFILIYLTILLVNYFLFLRKKKYLLIEKSFEKNTKTKRNSTFFFWLYLTITIVLIIFMID